MSNHYDGAFRSSHRRCFVKKGVLKNLANFTGKYLCWSLFLIKLQTWSFIKKDSTTGVFLWHLRNFLRNFLNFFIFFLTPILKNICERLLLSFVIITKCPSIDVNRMLNTSLNPLPKTCTKLTIKTPEKQPRSLKVWWLIS